MSEDEAAMVPHVGTATKAGQYFGGISSVSLDHSSPHRAGIVLVPAISCLESPYC